MSSCVGRDSGEWSQIDGFSFYKYSNSNRAMWLLMVHLISRILSYNMLRNSQTEYLNFENRFFIAYIVTGSVHKTVAVCEGSVL